MAAGAPVVCTDANGNRDFCRHEENCLMVEADPAAVAAASSACWRARPAAAAGPAGLETVQEYAWERRIEQLEALLRAAWPTSARSSGALPGERVGEGG